MQIVKGLNGEYELNKGTETAALEVDSTDPALTPVQIKVPASPTAPILVASVNGVSQQQWPAKGGAVLNSVALATNATDGFLYVAGGAGAPTGVPVAHVGQVPVYIDVTNFKIYLYVGGAWKATAALT